MLKTKPQPAARARDKHSNSEICSKHWDQFAGALSVFGLTRWNTFFRNFLGFSILVSALIETTQSKLVLSRESFIFSNGTTANSTRERSISWSSIATVFSLCKSVSSLTSHLIHPLDFMVCTHVIIIILHSRINQP